MILSTSTVSRVCGLNITMRHLMASGIFEGEGTDWCGGSLGWTGAIHFKLNRNISTNHLFTKYDHDLSQGNMELFGTRIIPVSTFSPSLKTLENLHIFVLIWEPF